jgi:hypothetical protein
MQARAGTKLHHKGTKFTKKNPVGVAFVFFVPLWCEKIFAFSLQFSFRCEIFNLGANGLQK